MFVVLRSALPARTMHPSPQLAVNVASVCIFDYVGLASFVYVCVHVRLLRVGRRARLPFQGRVTYLAAHHSPQIIRVDTVRAYHFGVRYLCEVDVVRQRRSPDRSPPLRITVILVPIRARVS